MTGSPLRLVMVKTFLGSRFGISDLAFGSARYLSQLERSRPLKRGFQAEGGRVYSGSAATVARPKIARMVNATKSGAAKTSRRTPKWRVLIFTGWCWENRGFYCAHNPRLLECGRTR